MRFSGDNPNPDEMLLLGGQKLELAGQKIVESAERVEYSWLKKDAEQEIYVRN